jgi:hypothetical protein
MLDYAFRLPISIDCAPKGRLCECMLGLIKNPLKHVLSCLFRLLPRASHDRGNEVIHFLISRIDFAITLPSQSGTQCSQRTHNVDYAHWT